MKPDATQHNPNPDYILGLVRQSGLSVKIAAKTIGIGERQFRRYIAKSDDYVPCPYTTQYCLENLMDTSPSSNK